MIIFIPVDHQCQIVVASVDVLYTPDCFPNKQTFSSVEHAHLLVHYLGTRLMLLLAHHQ